MPVRLRQVATVAHDLDATVAALTAGLGVDVCFSDPAVGEFGLHNALMALGDTFLEVVSPTRPGTTAGRYLDRRGGDAGYMVLVQVDDVAAARARVEALGIRVVFVADGPGIHGIHLHPADIGGAIVSLDQADPPTSWGWAGPAWTGDVAEHPDGRLATVEIAAVDPDALTARWAAVLDRPATGHRIDLDDGAIVVVPAVDATGEGVTAIGVRATTPADVGRSWTAGGIRIDVVD
ncbi:MAG TPA: VOC family protein [Acidimicrobiales bacterium]|nr:VOC family protein [Acidimicrobiales bacterium]